MSAGSIGLIIMVAALLLCLCRRRSKMSAAPDAAALRLIESWRSGR